MMGNWSDVRSSSGRLVARIDPERRLIQIVRNGEQSLIDLDAYLAEPAMACARPPDQAAVQARPGPQEVKA